MAAPVRIEGLAEFRRFLRTVEKNAPRELNKALKAELTKEVIPKARSLTPKSTGRLAASEKVGSRGALLTLRTPKVYGPVHHWGGNTWHARSRKGQPGWKPMSGHGYRATRYFTRALVSEERAIQVGVARAIEEFMRRKAPR